MFRNAWNMFFIMSLAPVKFHLMDRLFWTRDQNKVPNGQYFDKRMGMYFSQKDLGAVLKSFKWIAISLNLSY